MGEAAALLCRVSRCSYSHAFPLLNLYKKRDCSQSSQVSIWDIWWEVIFEWQGERRRGTFAHHSKWRVCSQAWIKPSFTVYSFILFRGHLGTGMHFASKLESAVVDPDRHIKGRWGGEGSHPHPEIMGGPVSITVFFSPLGFSLV